MKKIILFLLLISISITAQKIKHSQMDLNNVPLTGIPLAPTATAGTNTTQVATTAFVLANSFSNVYTPTLTNTLNITSSTLTNAHYTKIGNIINVTVGIQLTPTVANTNCTLDIDLPIPRISNTTTNIGGAFLADGFLGDNSSGVTQTSLSTTKASMFFKPLTTNEYVGTIIFSYPIN